MVIVRFAQSASHDAFFGCFTIQINFNDIIKFDFFFFQCCPKGFGLSQVTGKSVQQPAFFAIIFFKAVKNHGNRNIIRYKFAAIDKSFCLLSQWSFFGNILPENNACFNMGYAILLLHYGTLSSFATAVGAKN